MSEISTPNQQTIFELALSPFCPRGTKRQTLEQFFHGRARWQTIHSWRTGRRNPPNWALTLLAEQHQARIGFHSEIVGRLRTHKERPGLKAGAKNLAKWRASRNRDNT
jgi:hypothetical protein